MESTTVLLWDEGLVLLTSPDASRTEWCFEDELPAHPPSGDTHTVVLSAKHDKITVRRHGIEACLWVREVPRSSIGPGGILWDGSIAMLMHLSNPQVFADTYFEGKRVLELGAGTGMPGLYLAQRGATVVLTDLLQVLEVTRQNVAANDCTGKVVVCELDWEAADLDAVARLHGPFELVLACDVLYDSKLFVPLSRVLEVFCTPRTHALLTCESRLSGHIDNFFELVHTRGFSHVPVPPAMWGHHAGGQLGKVQMVALHRHATMTAM